MRLELMQIGRLIVGASALALDAPSERYAPRPRPAA